MCSCLYRPLEPASIPKKSITSRRRDEITSTSFYSRPNPRLQMLPVCHPAKDWHRKESACPAELSPSPEHEKTLYLQKLSRWYVIRSQYTPLFLFAVLLPTSLCHFGLVRTYYLYPVTYITGTSLFARQWDTRLCSCRETSIVYFHPRP